jgi:hypothetical protein
MTGEVKSLFDSLLSFDTMYDCRYTCKILKVYAASIADKLGEKSGSLISMVRTMERKTGQILFQANGNYEMVNLTI